jgi:hypothetical protein
MDIFFLLGFRSEWLGMTRNNLEWIKVWVWIFCSEWGWNEVGICSDSYHSYHSARILLGFLPFRSECVGEGKVLLKWDNHHLPHPFILNSKLRINAQLGGNFNYIRVQSGGLQWTPSSGLWSNFNYIRVQSGELRWTPPDPPSLDYSQVFFFLFQRTPADSSGSPMWRYVTHLESRWVQMSPAESGRTRGAV